MPMMSGKLPKPAAWGLLFELNAFFSISQEDREAHLDEYGKASAEREAVLTEVDDLREAAVKDLTAAGISLNEAANVAQVTVDDAEERAKGIINAATDQAKEVMETARQRVVEAGIRVEAADREVQARAEEIRSIETRVDDVSRREVAVKVLEATCDDRAAEANAVKKEFEDLIADLNAVRNRAPK